MSSSSCQSKYQVFLSFRGEDTRLNFTSHLLKALTDTGMNVFFDEEKLEKGEQLSLALSQAIAASNLSIIVLSVDYASSKSCLAELSDIMGRNGSQEHTVLPIFYHVDPSDVRNLSGSFKASFEEHESNRPLDEVKRWKAAFVEIGKLKGWHIEGGKFDRPDTEYIKDVVQYVIEKLNRKSRSVYEELVGIDDQKKTVLKLVEQRDSRVIGLWGMGGMGKTTLAEAVYNEISQTFQARYFLQNVREKIEKQGKESLRNELLSKLLNSKTCIDTPSIGSTLTQHRLKNMKVIVVLDDVNNSDQIELMGVKYLGDGSKIIVTSRDKQVLKNGGADKIHDLKKLNQNNSLQLFSTFAFKLLNPAPDFRDLSNKFLEYAQGSPLALKVLGSKLYTKCRQEWENEADKLKEYVQPKIFHILKRSFDELDESEKNIFLDIACFLKGESKKNAEKILSCLYKDAVGGISNLLDKCLLHIDSYKRISMHDMLEEMGKDIVRQVSNDPGKRSRLWIPKDVNQVLGYNKLLNLRYLHFRTGHLSKNDKLLADEVDSISLSSELRYLCWMFYPFKSLSPSFNPKNLVVLKLQYGYMEQLWNKDNQELVNLREIDLRFCKKLRRIPNLSRAINLQIFICTGCESLVELPRLNHLASLKKFKFEGFHKLKKFPEFPNIFSKLDLSHSRIKEVPDSIQYLVGLRELRLVCSRVENVSSNISKLESLGELDLSHCKRLKTLLNLPRNPFRLVADGCSSLEKVSFTGHNFSSFLSLHDSDDAPQAEQIYMSFLNCRSLNQESIKNIGENAMLQIEFLAQRWARKKGISHEDYKSDSFPNRSFCCFHGEEVSANEFEHRSLNSGLNLNLTPNCSSRGRFLAFVFCLVVDHWFENKCFEFICKYQLTTTRDETFTSEDQVFYTAGKDPDMGYTFVRDHPRDHVFILFSKEMIIIDNDYEKASFEFKTNVGHTVKKCGVHVLYVDAESYTINDVMRCDISTQSFASREDSESMSDQSFASEEDSESYDSQEDANFSCLSVFMLLRRRIGNRPATGPIGGRCGLASNIGVSCHGLGSK
ncbi:hypothetical protein V6N13_122191 [Hibiscus sabdariffa]